MKVENLFKRYLKTAGIFASNKSKKAINFMKEYSDVTFPFNSFRWDVTEEGFLFWFERALNWCIFLFNNYDNIDAEDITITKSFVAKKIQTMLLYYIGEEDKAAAKGLRCYKEAEDILKENGFKVD